MGSMAGEVKGGRPTFLKGIIGSLPIIVANYFGPIMIGLPFSPNIQLWNSGWFTTLAQNIAPWLGGWMVASSFIRFSFSTMLILVI